MAMTQLHAGLASFLSRSEVEQGSQHADGSVYLTFDRQYRVAFAAVTSGALLLEARVIELEDDRHARQSGVERLLESAGDLLERQTACLALARDGQMLVLQQHVPAQAAGQDFERILEQFINTLASCRRLAGVL